GDEIAVLVSFGLSAFGEDWDAWQPLVDIRSRPELATGREEERARLRHVGAKVIEGHADAFGLRFGDLHRESGCDLGLLTHGLCSDSTRSLKSVHGCGGMSSITVWPVRCQRLRQMSAAALPAGSWSTRMISRSIPGSTGNRSIAPEDSNAQAGCNGASL